MAIKRYQVRPGFTFNFPDGQKLRRFLPQEKGQGEAMLYGKDGVGAPAPSTFDTDEENVIGQEHKVEAIAVEAPKETAPKSPPKVEDKEVKGAEEKKEADKPKKRGRPKKKKAAE